VISITKCDSGKVSVTYVVTQVLLLVEAEYFLNILSRYKFSTCFGINVLFARESFFFTSYLGRSAVSLLLKLMTR
jgi:hypothetical protein